MPRANLSQNSSPRRVIPDSAVPRETLLSPGRASWAVARRYQLYIPFSSMYYYNYMGQIYLFIASFSSSLRCKIPHETTHFSRSTNFPCHLSFLCSHENLNSISFSQETCSSYLRGERILSRRLNCDEESRRIHLVEKYQFACLYSRQTRCVFALPATSDLSNVFHSTQSPTRETILQHFLGTMLRLLRTRF